MMSLRRDINSVQPQQAPAQQALVQQAPAQQAHIQQVPVQQALAQQGHVQQAPVQQAPAQQGHVQQGHPNATMSSFPAETTNPYLRDHGIGIIGNLSEINYHMEWMQEACERATNASEFAGSQEVLLEFQALAAKMKNWNDELELHRK
ncbi:MAG: hypothetical protein Q9212_001540 [Teloschistes hypoglaucus]